ncbi:hypothetical protein [Nonomuraea basaltis]|uniref:hypothetical protein n=1 Tax=Nonomuraea basaltis TaxID=2495887 RepID=UPI00110C6463|nr:hypothetical protein [Nonomuraea basaltis]TMR88899.1 hypothetical protein EJK15_63725 [Nonomuraea basaltis]
MQALANDAGPIRPTVLGEWRGLIELLDGVMQQAHARQEDHPEPGEHDGWLPQHTFAENDGQRS